MLQRVQRSAITKGVLNLYLNHLSRFLKLRQVEKQSRTDLQELSQQWREMTLLRSVVVEIIQNRTDNHKVESLGETE